MEWNAYIDVYCERLADGFWGEPLNALSNLSFILAALILFFDWPRAWRPALENHPARATSEADARLLATLIAVIGIASFSFHTLARLWAAVLDTGFIGLYLLTYIPLFLRRIIGLPWRLAWLGVPGFVGLALLLGKLMPYVLPIFAEPSVSLYISAFAALLILTTWSASRKHPSWHLLLAATVVFVASLTFRTLDLPLCADWPHGTHFLWHLLNGGVLYLSALGLIRSGQLGMG